MVFVPVVLNNIKQGDNDTQHRHGMHVKSNTAQPFPVRIFQTQRLFPGGHKIRKRCHYRRYKCQDNAKVAQVSDKCIYHDLYFKVKG
jgi:hemin uptake protein HemP